MTDRHQPSLVCLPYPHTACQSVAVPFLIAGLAVLGVFSLSRAFKSDFETDTTIVFGAAFIFSSAFVALSLYTTVIPTPLRQVMASSLGAFGYYIALLGGPPTIAALILGIGSITVGITHLIVENHV